MGFADNITNRIKTAFGLDLAIRGTRISKGHSSGRMTRTGYGGHAFSYDQSALSDGVGDLLRLKQDLVSRFIDYENMNEYPEISSALDVYAEDATVPNSDEKTIWARADDGKVRSILDDMLVRRLNIEHDAQPLARTLSLYGNAFGELLVTEDGVIGLNYLDPPTVRRVEDAKGSLLGFIQDMTGRFEVSPDDLRDFLTGRRKSEEDVTIFEPWEIVHWRLRSRKIRQPYGDSVMEQARWAWRRLVLLEDSVVIAILLRGGQRYVYYIDVGDYPGPQAAAFLNEIKNKFKKSRSLKGRDVFSQRYNPVASDEEIWLPTRGGKESTRIESIDGVQYRSMEDLEYFRDKLFSAIKVPRTFLGYQGTVNRNNLSSEDMRFARSVMRVQRELRQGFRHVGRVHLAALGIDPDMTDWGFKMNTPSSVFKMNEIELLTSQTALAMDMTQIFPLDHVLKVVYNLSDDEIKDLSTRKKKERFAAQKADMDAGGFGGEEGGRGGGRFGEEVGDGNASELSEEDDGVFLIGDDEQSTPLDVSTKEIILGLQRQRRAGRPRRSQA